MEVRATARNVRVSPRKARLLLRQLPGKGVDEVLAFLRYTPTPHARLVAKVVRSAAANAENNYQLDPGDLRIAAAYAGDGLRLKRYRARARGRVGMVQRRLSNITVVVAEREG
ncbi:MAG: 50S ribosomal protein L22 [Dehalococcoidia bacterium]